MKDAENLKFSVISMGDSTVDRRQPSDLRIVNLSTVHEYIDRIVEDQRVAAETKKIANGFPQGSLKTFCKKIRTHIQRAQKKVALTPIVYEKELGDENKTEQKNDINSIKDIPNEFD
jgi:hypothetical protein